MKNLFLSIAFFVSLTLCAQNNTATVSKYFEKYVFVYSKPIVKYTIVDSSSVNWCFACSPEGVIKKAVQNSYKSNIPFDAIIIINRYQNKYYVIKFDN